MILLNIMNSRNIIQFSIDFFKRETILCIALMLAAASSFFITPDSKYISYIDFRTLCMLFCLMAVMSGLKRLSFFSFLAESMLSKVRNLGLMVFNLWFLCFITSMLITNDVALITFVPFAITVLSMLPKEIREHLALPVISMQTVAANLGSMFTPIGNPQNLYLYAKSGISFASFLKIMAPYTILSFILLSSWTFFLCKKAKKTLTVTFRDKSVLGDKRKTASYFVLFAICIMAVGKIIKFEVALAAVLSYTVLFDRKTLRNVDYSLLMTFVGFFIFIGNMGRVQGFRNFLENIINGHETITAVISSQVISNVPAALLLSGFTDDSKALIIGTNLGGLGTLIASMASLISFKYVAKEDKALRLPYIKCFTASNIIFLALELALFHASAHIITG